MGLMKSYQKHINFIISLAQILKKIMFSFPVMKVYIFWETTNSEVILYRFHYGKEAPDDYLDESLWEEDLDGLLE